MGIKILNKEQTSILLKGTPVRKIELYFANDFVPKDHLAEGNKVAVVIDVMRATSSMCVALNSGANGVYFCEEVDEARELAEKLGRENVLLCGERNIVKIDGFDLGNSPADFTKGAVDGRSVITTTSNGTLALRAASQAGDLIVGSFLNRAAVVSYLMDDERDFVVVCAGRFGKFAIDDALCAGSILRELTHGVDDFELDDAANAAIYLAEYLDGQYEEVLEESASGKALEAASLLKDVHYVAKMDKINTVPILDKEINCLVAWQEK